MNFKDFEKLKQRYSDKVSETEDILKVLDKEIEDICERVKALMGGAYEK